MAKTIMVDGISCEMSDTAAQVVQKALATAQAVADDFELYKKKKKEEEETQQKDHQTLVAQKATLEAQLATTQKQLEDAKPTPQMIDSMVQARAQAVEKGRQLMGDKIIVDGKTVEEIRRQVVDASLGDVSKGWTDDQVTASFNSLSAAFGKTTVPGVTDLSAGFSRPASHQVAATDVAYKDYDTYLQKGRQAS